MCGRKDSRSWRLGGFFGVEIRGSKKDPFPLFLSICIGPASRVDASLEASSLQPTGRALIPRAAPAALYSGTCLQTGTCTCGREHDPINSARRFIKEYALPSAILYWDGAATTFVRPCLFSSCLSLFCLPSFFSLYAWISSRSFGFWSSFFTETASQRCTFVDFYN